jgi:hypothetical protein
MAASVRFSSGQATALAVLVVGVLTMLAVAVGVLLSVLPRRAESVTSRAEHVVQARALVDEFLEALAADETPEADSRLDPAWTLFSDRDGVVVEELSSRINLNFDQTFFLERSSLLPLLFGSEAQVSLLQEARLTGGFRIAGGSAFPEVLLEDAPLELVSPYSYGNVHVSGEVELERLYAQITDDPAAAGTFRSRLQSARSEGSPIAEADVLALLTPHFDRMYPLINAFGRFNVHFADERILEAVVTYPAFEIPNPQTVAGVLEGVREQAEMTPASIRATLGVAEDHRVLGLLGVRSWFWRLRVESGGYESRAILARLPGPTPAEDEFVVSGFETERVGE